MIEASSRVVVEPDALLLRRMLTVEPIAAEPGCWREDLRFFATAYVLGLIFFLLLIA